MGLLNFFKKKGHPSDKTQEDYIAMQSQYAEQMTDSFNDAYGGTFDFSEESLETLDEVLGMCRQNEDDLDGSEYENIVNQARGYLFEVAIRNLWRALLLV